MKHLLIAMFIFTGLSYAGITGKLSGKIKDQATGEPLVAATIKIVGSSLGAASDANGNYNILNIAPGTYTVKASYLGYETVTVSEVRIVADQTTRLDIDIRPQSLEVQEIVVTAKAPMIQKDITSSISVISRETIESLPVSNFTDLLSLQAGVVGSGGSMHIRGGRSGEVSFLIDGMYVKDPLLGDLATQINNDAIQEMNLLSGTFNAEYGNALSGVVNIVTRDGSDKFSGKAEMRTSEWGVDRYNDLNEMRMSASFSGPIYQDVLSFFVSGENQRDGSYLPFGYSKMKTGFGKLSWVADKSLKVVFSNLYSEGGRQNYNHSYKYIPEQYLRSRTKSMQTGLSITHVVAPEFFYDVKISYFNYSYYSGIDKDTSAYLPSQPSYYFNEIGNGYEFYSLSDPPEMTDSKAKTLDIKSDAVWQINNVNEVKFGIQYKVNDLKLFNIYDPKSPIPYLNNYHKYPIEAAAYMQDKIEFPFLIINLGLRFDYVNTNISYRENPLKESTLKKVAPRMQLSPRIGIAHPISDRTKLHFAYGHFFQNPDYQYCYENSQYEKGVREPLFGRPDLDAQRTIAYEFGISHQFNERVALHATAYYKDVTGLIGTKYYFPYVDNRPIGYTVLVNEDYANMKGFEVNLDIRPDKHISGGITYTYSIAKGSASSETEQYPGTSESTQLYYLDFDKTHVLNAQFAYSLDENEGPVLFGYSILSSMDFSLIGRVSSGFPYTPSGRDIGFVTKNSLRQPSQYSIDLSIGKDLKFDPVTVRIFAEIINLTDHRNVLYVYTDTGEPDFSYVGGHSLEYLHDPSNYGAPRSIRLGASVKF